MPNKKISDIIAALAACKSEEAVKASFIKLADLPAHISGKVDLYSGRVLFEFKYDVNLKSTWPYVLAQAVIYYKRIVVGAIDLPEPLALVLVDKNEACICKIHQAVVSALELPVKWGNAASSPDKILVKYLSEHVTDLIFYNLTLEDEMQNFLDTIESINSGSGSVKKIISRINFEDVFREWQACFAECFTKCGGSIGSYFIADMLEDALWDAKRGVLYFPTLGNTRVEIPAKLYEQFWGSYIRPPSSEVQGYIMQRAHMFQPDKTRRMTGAFFTPEKVARLSYEYLNRALGANWQDRYYVWDPCCGTGNLEIPNMRPDRLFMSTLDMNEVLMLREGNYFPGAEIFRFDFLNDSYFQLPDKLRAIIENEPQNMVVLMNPPYAEAGASAGGGGANKCGASFTKIGELMLNDDMGAAKNELFMQFMYRVLTEIPMATIAVFSTLKYIVAPNAAQFRDKMLRNKIPMMGFLVPGKVFPGVKGDFPIGFMIWGNGRYDDMPAVFDVYNIDLTKVVGTKVYKECQWYLNSWFKRPPNNTDSIPMIGPLTIKDGPALLYKSNSRALGFCKLHCNAPLNYNDVFYLSGVYHDGHGSAITPETFEFCMVSAAVRKLIKPTWLNDRDQFTVPYCDRPAVKLPDGVTEIATTGEYATDSAYRILPAVRTNLPADFISDCVVWVLFHGCNNSSSFTATYKGQQYIIPNEFYPFTKSQAAAMIRSDLSLSRAVERAADDTFVSRWLNNHGITEEAAAVLQAGKRVYERYYSELPNLHKVKYKLEFWNPGWYQIRMALKEHLGDKFPELVNLSEAMNKLRAKLLPKVYEYGFLSQELLDKPIEE